MKCDRRWWNDGRLGLVGWADQDRMHGRRRDLFESLWDAMRDAGPRIELGRITLPPGPNGYDKILEAL